MSTSGDTGSAVDRAIGGRVAWFMRSAGGKRRTQAELGEFLHLDQSAVSKKLRGERPFTVRELYAIAEWLERPIGSIVTEPDQLGEPPVLVPRFRRPTPAVRIPSTHEWMSSARPGRTPIAGASLLRDHCFRFEDNLVADVPAEVA